MDLTTKVPNRLSATKEKSSVIAIGQHTLEVTAAEDDVKVTMGASEARDITGSVQAHRLGCSSKMGAIPPWSLTKVAPDGYSRIKNGTDLESRPWSVFGHGT